MTYQGHVEDGMVVFDEPAALADGTRVAIAAVEVRPEEPSPSSGGPTLLDRLKPLIGTVKRLPPDASRNVDHYLYGHPKQ